MDNNQFVSKFCVNDKALYVKVDWKDNENDLFCMKIYDGDECWSGRFSNQFAAKFRERFDESKEEYSKNVKASLMNNPSMFAYEFGLMRQSSSTTNPNDATFSWKKKFENSVLVVHGSIPMHKDVSMSNKDSLIDILLQENKDLKLLVEEYELNIQMLTSELEQSRAELEKFMDIKSSLEMSVYGKFIQLLNGKKKRIQLLEQNLLSLQTHGNSLSDGELD